MPTSTADRGRADRGRSERSRSKTEDRPKTDARSKAADSKADRPKERDRGRATTAARSRGGDSNANTEERRWLEKNGDLLSKTTLRARWIHGTDEHQERDGQTLVTRDPEVIRRWAEERNAVPAAATFDDEGRPRTLRFDFNAPGDDRREDDRGRREDDRGRGRSSRLREVDWQAWLGVFQDRDLVFVYQEQLRDGRQSNFFRLDSPKREHE